MSLYILREWYVMSGLLFQHMSTGIVLVYPAIVIPGITSDFHATSDEVSWFMASYGLTGPIGFLILPAFMQTYGRKPTNILLNVITLTGSIIIALAPNITVLIAGRLIQGLAFGGWYLCCIMVAEFSHPKRRGFFIIFKITVACIGELICHSLGLTHLTWRQIMWLTTIPSILAVLVTLKWPESPSWLAYKGRYVDCASKFNWLRGNDAESKKELTELISAQQELRKLNTNYSDSFVGALHAFRSKDFLKPLLIVAVLAVLLQACGGYYLASYIVDIMAQLTGDRSVALYYTIGLDLVKTVGIFISSGVVTLFSRRGLLFSSSSLTCFLLTLICIFSYMESKGTLNLEWLTPSLLMIYFVLCCLTVIPLILVAKGEMFPLQYKGVGTCVIGIFLSIGSTVTLKWTLSLILVLGVHGMFSIYLCICLASLVWLYFILPETVNRTLQDIETDFIDLDLNGQGVELNSLKVNCMSNSMSDKSLDRVNKCELQGI